MEIKDIIKKRRHELNLTYEELGNMCGVGKTTVRKWELGLTEHMKVDKIQKLSEALKITPLELLGYDETAYSLDQDDKEIEREICFLSKSLSTYTELTYSGILEEKNFSSELNNLDTCEVLPYISNYGEYFKLKKDKVTLDNPYYSLLSSKSTELIALKVVDNSINNIAPTNSYAIVEPIINKSPENRILNNGDLIAVIIGELPATFRYYFSNSGSIVLSPNSTDKEYPPQIFYSDNENEIKVFGKVLGFITLPLSTLSIIPT